VRRKLERMLGQRHTFRATFLTFGKAITPGGRIVRYMLLQDILDNKGRFVTQHMWMPLRAHEYVAVPIRRGDMIKFSAEVNMYCKGSLKHRRVDYGLVRPRDVVRVEQELEMEA
jgi:hypothetical protein